MQTVNIHEAKTHLSRLIAQAQKGTPFVIAKSGKPVVIVSAIAAAPNGAKKRFGFLRDTMQVPDDFDRMGDGLIAGMFAGNEP
ncbi:MAG: type II toxin-antitoxin system prevent-host-death family antitoxin [Comamonadaceae bacterium]|nr:type II toxin-antitoxin system prevent-host-death family antitoxin [Comamonadaceae bacterium]